jgi:heme/copper-type cytochrome/quinol oxidase subunit 2
LLISVITVAVIAYSIWVARQARRRAQEAQQAFSEAAARV